jgi:hypothetical protein
MPDPNDTLATIQMLCDDIAKSNTALGYNADLMRKLGTWVFGSLDAVRDAIQAPDGQSWRAGMFAEAERRGDAEADAVRLHKLATDRWEALLELKCRDDRNGSLPPAYRKIIDAALAINDQQEASKP